MKTKLGIFLFSLCLSAHGADMPSSTDTSKTIDLSNRRLITVPFSDIGTKVKALILSNNNLNSLEGLERYPDLELLDLTGNQNLKTDSVDRLRGKLPNCIILHLDETIYEAPEVDYLKDFFLVEGRRDASSRLILRQVALQLEKQPEDVTNEDLKKITKLDLTDQPISHASCLKGLPELVSLNISGTRITKLPRLNINLRVLTAFNRADLTLGHLQAMVNANPGCLIIHPDWKMRDAELIRTARNIFIVAGGFSKPKATEEVGKVTAKSNRRFTSAEGAIVKYDWWVVVLDRSAPAVKKGDQLLVKRGKKSWEIQVERVAVISDSQTLVCFSKKLRIKDQIKVGDKVFR